MESELRPLLADLPSWDACVLQDDTGHKWTRIGLLLRLLSFSKEEEQSTLDFKMGYYEKPLEFAKDVSAIYNSRSVPDIVPGYGFLVIGIQHKGGQLEVAAEALWKLARSDALIESLGPLLSVIPPIEAIHLPLKQFPRGCILAIRRTACDSQPSLVRQTDGSLMLWYRNGNSTSTASNLFDLQRICSHFTMSSLKSTPYLLPTELALNYFTTHLHNIPTQIKWVVWVWKGGARASSSAWSCLLERIPVCLVVSLDEKRTQSEVQPLLDALKTKGQVLNYNPTLSPQKAPFAWVELPRGKRLPVIGDVTEFIEDPSPAMAHLVILENTQIEMFQLDLENSMVRWLDADAPVAVVACDVNPLLKFRPNEPDHNILQFGVQDFEQFLTGLAPSVQEIGTSIATAGDKIYKTNLDDWRRAGFDVMLRGVYHDIVPVEFMAGEVLPSFQQLHHIPKRDALSSLTNLLAERVNYPIPVPLIIEASWYSGGSVALRQTLLTAPAHCVCAVTIPGQSPNLKFLEREIDEHPQFHFILGVDGSLAPEIWKRLVGKCHVVVQLRKRSPLVHAQLTSMLSPQESNEFSSYYQCAPFKTLPEYGLYQIRRLHPSLADYVVANYLSLDDKAKNILCATAMDRFGNETTTIGVYVSNVFQLKNCLHWLTYVTGVSHRLTFKNPVIAWLVLHTAQHPRSSEPAETEEDALQEQIAAISKNFPPVDSADPSKLTMNDIHGFGQIFIRVLSVFANDKKAMDYYAPWRAIFPADGNLSYPFNNPNVDDKMRREMAAQVGLWGCSNVITGPLKLECKGLVVNLYSRVGMVSEAARLAVAVCEEICSITTKTDSHIRAAQSAGLGLPNQHPLLKSVIAIIKKSLLPRKSST